MSFLNRRRRKLLWKALKRMDASTLNLKYLRNRWKVFRADRMATTAVPYPVNFMLELSCVCNLHCITCPREYEYGKQMDCGFMPLDKALRIVDEVVPYLDSIGLTGLGETFLYPADDMLELVRHIKRRKKSVIITVSTNAHFKGFLEKIKPVLPYLDNIQFSVDGVGEVYERIRPGTDFEFIKRNIRETVSLAPDLEYMINCVVSDANYRDMSNILHLAHELGIRSVNFNNMSIASMPQRDHSYYEFFNSDVFREAVEAMRDVARRYPEMEVTGPDASGKSLGFRDCIFPWAYPYITWNGYYVPCCGKPFPKLLNFGNVFDDGGVMNVLNSAKAQAFRRLWQENRPPSFCHNCMLAPGV